MIINNLFSIRVYQFNRIPVAVGIGTNRGVFIGQWVNAQPHGHQLVVHVAGSEVTEAGFLVAFLTVFDFIHRCSVPLTGCFAGESERVFAGITMLNINIFQTPKIEGSGIVESADWIACYVAVSMQNGLYLRS